MKPKIIYLDLDGVIVDFHEGAIRAHLQQGPLKLPHGTYYEPGDASQIASQERWPPGTSLMKYLGIDSIEQFWQPINTDPLFWRGLRPYPWWRRIIELCQCYCDHLVICTTPSTHHFSWGGKALWIHQHGLNEFPCIMLDSASNGKPKGQTIGKWMLASPERLLIDDWQRQTDSFSQSGGQSILFPQPWNSNHPYMNDPVGFVADQLMRLEEK